MRIYRFFWLGGVAALMAVGAPRIGKSKSAIPLADHGRDSSVNSVLQHTLGQPGMAEAVTEWLSQFPAGRPILVLAPPGHMDAALSANLISYLAWPRPVIVSLDSERSAALLQNFRERYAAVGLCYLAPPPGVKPDKQFGPALGFIVSQSPPQ